MILWCGFCSGEVIGLYYFLNDASNTVIAHGAWYKTMTRDYLTNGL